MNIVQAVSGLAGSGVPPVGAVDAVASLQRFETSLGEASAQWAAEGGVPGQAEGLPDLGATLFDRIMPILERAGHVDAGLDGEANAANPEGPLAREAGLGTDAISSHGGKLDFESLQKASHAFMKEMLRRSMEERAHHIQAQFVLSAASNGVSTLKMLMRG